LVWSLKACKTAPESRRYKLNAPPKKRSWITLFAAPSV
jgi:hypothetical protein